MVDLDKSKSIRLTEFLYNYLGIEHKSLKNATHHDLKEFQIPYVQAVPFDIVSEEDINKGNIILVTDKLGHIAPYIRPSLLKSENIYILAPLEKLYKMMYEAIYEEEIDMMMKEFYGENYKEDIEKSHK